MLKSFLLPAWLFALGACSVDGTHDIIVDVNNPTTHEFEGSGGALGFGLEIRADGVEDDKPLLVDPTCEVRSCGQPSVTDPGRCGVKPRTIPPGESANLRWDGRYYPRGNDAQGECLGPIRAVRSDVTIRLAVCGRLVGDDVRMAPLQCREKVLPARSAEEAGNQVTVDLVVPGAPLAPGPSG